MSYILIEEKELHLIGKIREENPGKTIRVNTRCPAKGCAIPLHVKLESYQKDEIIPHSDSIHEWADKFR